MKTIAEQLAALSLDFEDTHGVIEDDDERQDVMGDLPDWENMSLNEFYLDYYYRRRHKTHTTWHPIESKLGDGWYSGKPTWKGDAETDSIRELAAREVTMLKFFAPEEVKELKRHIKAALEASSDEHPSMVLEGDEYSSGPLQVVYEMAKARRWEEAKKNKGAVLGLLKKLSMNPENTIKSLYHRTVKFTHEVRRRAENQPNPSAFRKEQRDAYIEAVQATLKLNKLYGRAWRFFNSLYWNTLFQWNADEAHDIMAQCAERYAYSISYDLSVNS
jgi:hypothetical protein